MASRGEHASHEEETLVLACHLHNISRSATPSVDCCLSLTTIFVQLADNLRAQIARAHNTLVVADWSGQSRGAANAAEAQLNGDLDTTLEGAQAGVETLGSALSSQVEAFYLDVTGQFTNLMSNIEGVYGELSRDTRMFADNLAQADQTISFGA